MSNITSSIIKDEFQKRKDKNSLYSIRAFARDLGIGKTTLHELLNGERKISKNTCIKIAKNLQLDEETTEKMVYENTVVASSLQYKQLSSEEFEKISTCQHYALLSLAKLPHCPSNLKELAKRINIPESETKNIVNDLIELKLIDKKDDRLFRTSKPITTTHDVPNQAIKNYHRSSLDQIKSSLDEISVDLRDITSSTFPMDPEKINILKEEIKKLKRKLIKKVEDTNEESEVFQMNISVIPLSKRI